MDSGKVEYDFDRIWSGLPSRKKVSIIFLYKGFQNSTLFNLGIVKPNFSLMKYQFLMCYPYQPDSEVDQWVRVANYLKSESSSLLVTIELNKNNKFRNKNYFQ